jgi:glycine cleavage system H protein
MTTYYTKDHEYLLVDASGDTATVGITDYAQHQLGDVVFVELPSVGKVFAQGAESAVVESVKAASEIYAPVSGTVTHINTALESNSALVNEDSMGQGWFYKMSLSNLDELKTLMDASAYESFVASLG